MATLPHQPVHERPEWAEFMRIPEMWASLAISMMWLAVLFDSVYGPSLVTTNGTQTTTIPSGIIVALLACLGTAAVARHGFRRSEE